MIYDFIPIVELEQDNLNSKTYLSSIKVQVMESLRSIQHAPGVQMQEVRLCLFSQLLILCTCMVKPSNQTGYVNKGQYQKFNALKYAFPPGFFSFLKTFYLLVFLKGSCKKSFCRFHQIFISLILTKMSWILMNVLTVSEIFLALCCLCKNELMICLKIRSSLDSWAWQMLLQFSILYMK